MASRACAPTSDGVHTNTLCLAGTVRFQHTHTHTKTNSVNNIFPNQFGTSRLLDMSHFMCCVFGFHILKQVPICISCLEAINLQHCFAVKLQNCFMVYQTPPTFPSAWRWVDNNWIFIFGWIFPLTRYKHFYSVIVAAFKMSTSVIMLWMAKHLNKYRISHFHVVILHP